MNKNEIEFKVKELNLIKRGQNLGLLKFFIGGFALGLAGFFLDFDKLIHSKSNDDRNFLVQRIELLRESDPTKRLENIKFLQGINGKPSTYLEKLEKEAEEEIRLAELDAEVQRKTDERKRLEAEQHAQEEIEIARKQEEMAIAIKEAEAAEIIRKQVELEKENEVARQRAYQSMRAWEQELLQQGYHLP